MKPQKQDEHSETIPSQAPLDLHDQAPTPKRISARKALIGILVLVAVTILLAIAGIIPRVRARDKLKNQADALAAPFVIAIAPVVGNPGSELVLPGNVFAYTDSPIYARTSGYLEKWYFDIGSHVRKGQLLATISSPEVDQQLLQARADLATAEASAGLAKTNAARYRKLFDQNAVSKQDTDTFISQRASTGSAVKSAQANVQRLEELQSFEKIYAPFDGVITARNVDVGQLIEAGAAQQMFHLAAIRVLRVYVNVPQIYSRGAVPGSPAYLTLAEFPGQKFPGKVVRTANAIDPGSRTLLAEIDVNNANGKLVPGAYAQVHMNLNTGIPAFIIPVSALIFRGKGLQAATVVKGPKGDQVKLVDITLGQDDGRTVQVVTGLDQNSRVIQIPPDSLVDGELVHVVQPRNAPEAGDNSDNGITEP